MGEGVQQKVYGNMYTTRKCTQQGGCTGVYTSKGVYGSVHRTEVYTTRVYGGVHKQGGGL
jgi:hypothetical protein